MALSKNSFFKIIFFSFFEGLPALFDKEIIFRKELFEKEKKNKVYKKVLEIFPDAELIDIKKNIENNND